MKTGITRREFSGLGAAAALLLARPAYATATAGPRRAPLIARSRSIHSGHSLTDAYVHEGPWPGNLRLIAKSVFGRHFSEDGDGRGGIVKSTIPGSTLAWRWEHPTKPVDARHDIAGFGTLMITEGGPPPRPGYGPDQGALRDSLMQLMHFVRNAYENGAAGAGAEVILWSIWPDISGWTDPNHPNAANLAHWAEFGGLRGCLAEYGRCFKYMADYATWKMHQEYADLPQDWRVWLFPGHLFIDAMAQQTEAGQLPGISALADLFSRDDPGHEVIHPNSTLGYGLAAFVFTLLYQLDLGQQREVFLSPEFADHRGEHPAVSPELAARFWQTAWQIASSYEPAGMGGADGAEPVFRGGVDADPLA